MNGKASPSPTQGYNFGTFKGVFTPSLLTILGVIMYLRFGWVLGNVGLFQTLFIVTLACMITFLTGVSISELATNMRIGGGGAYYIISRSLGIEAGGAIGLPLFLAQALGIAFYIAGFAESICSLFPALPQVPVGLVTLAVLAALAYFSADIALKFQFFILTAILLSLVSFFAGHVPAEVVPAEAPATPQLPFWFVFAVFFPAVTGIEAGLAMSGDLKNPERSLPLGTLGAIVFSYFVYLAIPIFLTHIQVPKNELIHNSLIFKDIARWGSVVLVGLWGATLSSALGALLGAPRTLQALSRDGVIPRWIGRGFGPKNDPRAATFIAAMIGAAGLCLGDLNVIAPLLTMFFLTSYGLLNLSAAAGGFLSGPAWRPKFRFHWGFSAAGAAACFLTMLMLDAGATIVAVLISIGIYTLLARRKVNAYWGDMRYGIYMFLIQTFLYKVMAHPTNEKTWRPNILVLSGTPSRRWYLIALADALSHGKGFLTVATILFKEITHEQRENTRKSIKNYLKERSVPAIVKVMADEDILQGARTLVKAYGFGPLVPNTILLGDTENRENYLDYCSLILSVHRLHRNLVIVRESDLPSSQQTPQTQGRIDLWWRQKGQNSGFMLALAYVLMTSPEWEGSQLCIKTVVDSEEDRADVEEHLKKFVQHENIEAGIEVYAASRQNVFALLREKSADAAMIFMGLRAPEAEESSADYSVYYQNLLQFTDGFPATALVLSAEDLDFDRIFQLRQTVV